MISYLVTVHNKAAFLPAVLEALIVERDDTVGEIVIVDNGSTDGSGRILDEFAAAYDLQVIHQQDRGVAASTNILLTAARHPFIRLIDGDDTVVRGSSRLLLDCLQTTGAGFAFGRAVQFTPGCCPAEAAPTAAAAALVNEPLTEMIRHQMFAISASLGRKDVYDRVLPLPEAFRTSQDYALGLRLVRLTGVVRVDARCCYTPSNIPGRLSANVARMYHDTIGIILMHWVDWPDRSRRFAIRRNAWRAYLYVIRRDWSAPDVAALAAIRLASYLPLPWSYRLMMARVAKCYEARFADEDRNLAEAENRKRDTWNTRSRASKR